MGSEEANLSSRSAIIDERAYMSKLFFLRFCIYITHVLALGRRTNKNAKLRE